MCTLRPVVGEPEREVVQELVDHRGEPVWGKRVTIVAWLFTAKHFFPADGGIPARLCALREPSC